MKKVLSLLLALALLLVTVGCGANGGAANEGTSTTPPVKSQTSPETLPVEEVSPEQTGGKIILATTTSTQDSGLLDFLLPIFTEETGVEVDVVAVGTGQAIRMGEDGEADALLVHATASEEKFVEEGHSSERRDVMYNDFVLIGPKGDVDGIKASFDGNIVGALDSIAEKQLTFVSRGDDSGTHKKELSLWGETATAEPTGEWYKSVGKGMGDTINMANEMLGYTLSDRATYLSMENISLEVIVEGDDKLFNQYGVLVVNPEKNENINSVGAQIFADWMVSLKTQDLIKTFGVEEYGEPLFTPNAKQN